MDNTDLATDGIDVRRLLDELRELRRLDALRRTEPHDSPRYSLAANEVDRRSRELMHRIDNSGTGNRQAPPQHRARESGASG